MMARVIKNSFEALTLLLFFVLLGVIVFGSLIFFAESGYYDPVRGVYVRDDPEGGLPIPTPFKSIPVRKCFLSLPSVLLFLHHPVFSPLARLPQDSFYWVLGTVNAALPTCCTVATLTRVRAFFFV